MLLFVKVGDCGPVFDFTEAGSRTGIVEEGFGEHRLAGTAVGRKHNVAY